MGKLRKLNEQPLKATVSEVNVGPTIEVYFKVQSSKDPNTYYDVHYDPDGKKTTCECPGFMKKGTQCKHIKRARDLYLGFLKGAN